MKNKKLKQNEIIKGPALAENPDGGDAFCLTNAACAAECTGLIQIPPESEDELESYNDVYSFATKINN